MVFHTSSVLSETSSNSPGRVSEEVVNPTCSASTPEGALSSWGRKILGRPDCINSRIVRGSREVEQDTASNTPAQKAAAVMWDLRYLFIIQLFISCFNR
ncbi:MULTISPECIES: hypothetical protein [Bacteroidaceae]|nr:MULTISPECIES: hypothetical protein [Bacteroides]MCB6631101.1 hypothetical protein [Bacteroides faecis]MCB7008763.1 hypothetical protein [Bacteroides thetaiotaomicron]MCB7364750.1 hypothetical protein [Bacteroides thetaiotaomicron]MCD0219018.1 hypothetical protein [Bacteroides sp. 1_1_30]MCQ5020539.1 hypothetical protein [Bacteroides thetaiotaomicron]